MSSLQVTITASDAALHNATLDSKLNSLKFTPAARVRLEVCATGSASDAPVTAGAIGVTVTDARTLFQTQKRRQHPRLPAMVLLETGW
jgi:hypothetical protein